jgi:hypothetical protein
MENAMEMMTLKMTGMTADGVQRYRSYYLVTDGGHMAGIGRASAIPMSAGAPMPEDDYVQVKQGGEEHALKSLVEVLCALPGNENMSIDLNPNPS